MSLRAFVETFPPLKIALYVNDAICFVLTRLLDFVYYAVRNAIALVYYATRRSIGPIYRFVRSACSKLSDAIPPIRRFKEEQARKKYERLKEQHVKLHEEPVPYYSSDHFVKRLITYHGGLVLALLMYVFVYFVLVKHHTYLSLSVAFVLMLAYLIIVENSHNIRSILMLCMPIMFTNRGRALVFCSMLAMLAGGPIRTMQHNVREIHLSLNCCKQYFLIRTDQYVGDNVVSKLVRLEEVVMDLVNNIRVFASDIRRRLDGIIKLAIDTELYIVGSIEKLREALRFCKRHKDDVRQKCAEKISALCAQMNSLSGSFGCTVLKRAKHLVCNAPSVRDIACQLPQHVVEFFERTIGRKLAAYVDLIENEFYVDVDVKRSYAYNVTKSKSFLAISQEIKFDVEQKFWYVSLVRQVFNFVSLILVTWIFLTSTIYHMHYLRDLSYDNMYLDERLEAAAHPRQISLTPEHAKLYLKPFSIHMNKNEVSKLYVSGLVWLIIIGYISFFVLLDFSLYQLVHFLIDTLRDILFTNELPLIDLETKSQRASGSNIMEDTIVRYNRTYLSSLRKRLKPAAAAPATGANFSSLASFNSTTDISGNQLYTTNKTVLADHTTSHDTTSSIQAFYDRLMESLIRDIPDDVAILESLESCLPKPQAPLYETYRALLYLALFTFVAVVVEAYALRTRHCIADLYYPRRARQRSKWLARKIITEKPRYDEMDELEPEGGQRSQDGIDLRERREKKRRRKPLDDSLRTVRSDIPSNESNRTRRDEGAKDTQSLGYGFHSVE